MKTLLTCPVCSRPEIEDDICPNCETDLLVMRMLAELPPSAPIQPLPTKKLVGAARLPATVAIVILVLLISVGAFGYYWISHLPPPNSTVPPTNCLPKQQSQVMGAGGFRYTVRIGDSLPLIAWRFYRDIKLWPLIVKANPSLKGRENSLEVGEVLLVPNREEDSRGQV